MGIECNSGNYVYSAVGLYKCLRYRLMKKHKRKVKCSVCGVCWESERPHADVVAEADDLFPGMDINNPDEMGVVCEPCFIKVMDYADRTDFFKYIDKDQLN